MPRRCRPIFALAAVLAAWLLAGGSARAVVVLRKGATQPILGYLVHQDANAVVVREVVDGGASRELTILRGEIDELVITVAPERLAELDPAKPRLYREYAEELAEKARDPEARDAAIRLFHMAAWLDEGPIRKGSLLGLAALARTPAEAKRLRAAAYLYDPEHDRTIIQAAADAPLAAASADPAAAAALLQAFRLLRQGKPSEAKAIAERPASRTPLDALAKIITRDEFIALCTVRPLSDQELRKVLVAEITLQRAVGEKAGLSPADADQPTTAWSQAVKTGGLAPLPPLDLAHLTEFDPRACLFRDGKWVVP